MLKCHIDRAKKKVWVKAKGTPHDLMVETTCLIRDIFHHINQEVPDAAKEYKMKLLGMLLNPESPVWTEDDHGKQ